MKYLILTKEEKTLLDNEDFQWLNQWKWYLAKNGYAVRNSARNKGKRKTIYLHKEILSFPSKETDHINGNKLDNRRKNLRIATHQENSSNYSLPQNNTSGFKGLWKNKRNKWQVSISFKNKRIHIGTYNNKTEAAKAYNTVALVYHEKFAKLNKI